MIDDRLLFEESYKWNYPNAELIFDKVTQGYLDPTEQRCYMMWQLSASREGYKLVPLKPSYRQLDSLKSCCIAMHRADLSDLEAYGVYKTALGIERDDG